MRGGGGGGDGGTGPEFFLFLCNLNLYFHLRIPGAFSVMTKPFAASEEPPLPHPPTPSGIFPRRVSSSREKADLSRPQESCTHRYLTVRGFLCLAFAFPSSRSSDQLLHPVSVLRSSPFPPFAFLSCSSFFLPPVCLLVLFWCEERVLKNSVFSENGGGYLMLLRVLEIMIVAVITITVIKII